MNRDPKPGSDRSFGITFGIVFLLASLLPFIGAKPWFCLVGAARGGVFGRRNRSANDASGAQPALVSLGLLLQRIVSPVVLSLLFLVAIVPAGLIMRLFGKNLLTLRKPTTAGSYWIDRAPGPTANSLRDQF